MMSVMTAYARMPQTIERRGFIMDTSLVLYVPLWHRAITGNPFTSRDSVRHTCTAIGTVWGSQGRYFDGLDDLVSVPHNAVLNLATAGTIATWFKCTNKLVYREIISKNQTGDGFRDPYLLRVEETSGRLIGRVGNGVDSAHYIDSGIDVGDNTWHFAAFTWAVGGNITIQVDTTVVTGALTIAPYNNNTNLWIGDGYFGIFKGTAGEVWFYNRALSLAEVRHNYYGTRWRYGI